MSTLVINDLEVSKELDRAAAMQICGGGLPWAVARRSQSGMGPYSVTNNFINNDYSVINQNPTFFNVYNGDNNSGTIVNSFSTLSLVAGSTGLSA
jgi:hypothetical protein